MIHESFNKPPYSCFVCPDFCYQLQLAGLTRNTVYLWSLKNTIAELVTFWFDKDDYYGAAAKIIYQQDPTQLVPAYDFKDLERILPGGYLLTRNGFDEYELSLDEVWQCQPVKGKRLPDVFAVMVLHLIAGRRLNMESVNAEAL